MEVGQGRGLATPTSRTAPRIGREQVARWGQGHVSPLLSQFGSYVESSNLNLASKVKYMRALCRARRGSLTHIYARTCSKP